MTRSIRRGGTSPSSASIWRGPTPAQRGADDGAEVAVVRSFRRTAAPSRDPTDAPSDPAFEDKATKFFEDNECRVGADASVARAE